MAVLTTRRNSDNMWIKLTGPAAESLAKAFCEPAVVVLQENKEVRRCAEKVTAEEDASITPRGVEVTARVETMSVPPTRVVIEGTAGTGKSVKGIKVLKTYRIVLLGKTGAGKSSLANTILGEDVFKINHAPICGTRECQAESKVVHGRRITVVDTPGFFDTDRPEEELKPEIVKCITECAPGPHAFFIVLKVEKFTKHQQAVITKILQHFPEEALKYAAVVFTHGDKLPKGMKIEEFVDQNKCLSDLGKKCSGRCHVVDNENWKNNQEGDYRSNKFQVAELLNTTDKTVMENKGGCYTSKMLQAVTRRVEEEGNRTSEEKMPKGDTSNKANNSISKNVWIKLTGPAAESLVKAFCGLDVVVSQESGGEEEEEATETKEETEENTATETEEEAEEKTATETEEKTQTIQKPEQKPRTKEGGGLMAFISSLCAFFFFSSFGLGSWAWAGIAAVMTGIAAAMTGIAAVMTGIGTGAGPGAPGAPNSPGVSDAPNSPGVSDAPNSPGVSDAPGRAAKTVLSRAIKVLYLLFGGAGVWGVQKIAQMFCFIKALPRHIGIILLVFFFFSLILLSFGVKVLIVGTIFLWFGVILSFLLLVLLFLLL